MRVHVTRKTSIPGPPPQNRAASHPPVDDDPGPRAADPGVRDHGTSHEETGVRTEDGGAVALRTATGDAGMTRRITRNLRVLP